MLPHSGCLIASTTLTSSGQLGVFLAAGGEAWPARREGHAPRHWGTIDLRDQLKAVAGAILACAAWLCAACDARAAEATRTISLYNIHSQETLVSTYKKDGKYVSAEMEKVNWILRDWRRNEATTMDPELIDLLWEVHSELGSREPIHIISGYRSRGTNDMLRKSVGGQAKESRHILGKAADVHFPDVPVKALRYSALIREKGGVGYYPTSAIPFVHMDIDRVRAWPRLPRAELALLFPKGSTQHVPSDGGPLTRDDVRIAKVSHKDLAVELAQFHDLRARPRLPIQTASFSPPLPKLISEPQLVDRRGLAGSNPSDHDRAKLAALIGGSPQPQLLWPPSPATRKPGVTAAAYDPTAPAPTFYREGRVVPAPEYDDEHPEELSYRPFPIAPFLTVTASADDPALAGMVHPNLAKVLETMDQENVAPPMRLRPGVHAAERLWAHQFKGDAVDLSSMLLDAGAPSGPRVPSRKVATQPQ
jgi:uncharacterized protein YcbK (DUF882 family)